MERFTRGICPLFYYAGLNLSAGIVDLLLYLLMAGQGLGFHYIGLRVSASAVCFNAHIYKCVSYLQLGKWMLIRNLYERRLMSCSASQVHCEHLCLSNLCYEVNKWAAIDTACFKCHLLETRKRAVCMVHKSRGNLSTWRLMRLSSHSLRGVYFA